MQILQEIDSFVAETFRQLTPKDLLLLFLGAVGSSVGKLLVRFLIQYRRVGSLLGSWHSYHWSRIDLVPRFVHSIIRIERRLYGIRVTIVATERMSDPEAHPTYKEPRKGRSSEPITSLAFWEKWLEQTKAYRGSIRIDGHDVLIDFKAANFDEIGHMRLTVPIPHERTMMIGLGLGIDYSHQKYATVRICSRDPLSPKEANEIIRARARLCEKEASLRVAYELPERQTVPPPVTTKALHVVADPRAKDKPGGSAK